MKLSRLPPIVIIILTVLLDSIGLGLITPALPTLVLDTTNSSFLGPEASASWRGGILSFLGCSYMIGQFLGAPFFGGLSAAKGIRKILIPILALVTLCNIGGTIGIILKSSILLIASQWLRGIAMGCRTILSLFAVNISAPKDKVKSLGWIGASAGLGLIIGPYLGGLIIGTGYGMLSFALPFIIASILAIYNAYIMNKTLKAIPQANTPPEPWSPKQTIRNLSTIVRTYTLRPLFLTILLFFVGWEIFYSLSPVFLVHRFHFTAQTVGVFYAWVGLFSIIGNSVLVLITSKFPSRMVLLACLPIWGVGLLALIFVSDVHVLWYLLPIAPAIGGVIISTSTALFTDLVSDKLRGEVLGAFQSLQACAAGLTFLTVAVIAPHFPTLPIICGFLALMGATAIWFGKITQKAITYKQ